MGSGEFVSFPEQRVLGQPVQMPASQAAGRGGALANRDPGLHDERRPFSLVIPARLGDERVVGTVDRFLGAIRGWGAEFEIVVVTDGQRVVEGLSDPDPLAPGVRHLYFDQTLGKGGAILKGIELARFDTVALMDGDGSVTPVQLHSMLNQLNGSAAVVGSRRAPGSNVTLPASGMRQVASAAFNALVRAVLFLPHSDTQCGLKVLKRSKVLPFLSSVAVWGFAFDASLLFHLHRAGLPVREVAVQWEHRSGSTLNLVRVVPKMLVAVVGIRVLNSPARAWLPKRLIEVTRTWLNNP